MRPNTAKRLLMEGKPALGTWMNMATITGAEFLSYVGWDWLVLDIEHGCFNPETMQAMFIAIGTTGTIPMARIAWNDPCIIKQTLDAGALGVVVPMVCTPEEAAKAVAAAKYPPDGIRSAGGGRWRYWAGSDYPQHANEEILVMVMIEHQTAVENAEAILRVPGVDGAFIGPNDLAWSMGLKPHGLGEQDPAHAEAVAKVLAAGKKTGVPVGIHCRSKEEVVQRIKEGFQFLACTNDVTFMMSAATAARQYIKDQTGF
jgi:4-hydroxy-2-oxoheptanedioate aldolase